MKRTLGSFTGTNIVDPQGRDERDKPEFVIDPRRRTPHSWPTTVTAARAIQLQLRRRVIMPDMFQRIETVAGIDVGFENGARSACAAVVVFSFPDMVPTAQAQAR